MLIAPAPVTDAPPYVSWGKAYDSGGYDEGWDIAIDSNNNIIVTGYIRNGGNYNVSTTEYDSNGNVIWTRIFDNKPMDAGWGVAVDSSNNIIVTGYTGENLDNRDFLTIKYDSNGNLVWVRTYDGGGEDAGWDVAVDSDDNIIVTGWTMGVNWNYCTIKYDPSGNVVWVRIFDNGFLDYAHAVAVDSNNNVIVTGTSHPPSENFNYCTVKYDSNGDVMWAKSYDRGVYEDALSVAADSNNNIIVTGKSNLWQPGRHDPDYFTIKYGPNGNVIWTREYNGGGLDEAWGVAVDMNNNVIVTGRSEIEGDNDYFTIEYDSNGNVIWTKIYDSQYDNSDNDTARRVAVDLNNNVIVTGFSVRADGNYDYYTIKYTEAPSLILPENNAVLIDNTPTFEWTSVSDPSGVTYQIQIDDNIDFSSPVYAVGLADNTHTLPDENSLAIGTYYWHVRAKDGVGNVGEWSETWNFTVVPIAAVGALLMSLLMLLPFASILRRQNRRYHY